MPTLQIDRIVKAERDNAILITQNGQLKKTIQDQKAGNTHLQERLTAVLALNKTQAARPGRTALFHPLSMYRNISHLTSEICRKWHLWYGKIHIHYGVPETVAVS